MRDFINFIVFTLLFVGSLYCFTSINKQIPENPPQTLPLMESAPLFILPESAPIAPPKIEPKEELNLPAKGIVLEGAKVYVLRDGKAVDTNTYIKVSVQCEVFHLVEIEDKNYLIIKITQEGFIPSIYIVERRNVAVSKVVVPGVEPGLYSYQE